MDIKKSLMELVGNTPLLELVNIEKKYNLKSKIYAKVEYFNPALSVKDRVAKEMILGLIADGKLKKGGTIIEPTSGNTGIGLCAIGANMGYNIVIVMPENMSIERIKIMKAYGAKVFLTKANLGMAGAIAKANELNKEIENSIIAGQFDNPRNPLAHYKSTAKEIYEQTDGDFDFFVAGIGTGGTISGCAKYFKEKNKNIKIVGVEPLSSPFINKKIKGLHKIQGIGAGFIPSILDLNNVDEVSMVSDDDAIYYGKEIARIEGLLVGISSGAALFSAINIAKMNDNKKIVVLLPDTGDRYLSTSLFD